MIYKSTLVVLVAILVLANTSVSSGFARAEDMSSKVHSSAMQEEAGQGCSDADMRLVKMRLKNDVSFEIPAAYLYDPYGVYHKNKDAASFINLRVTKDGFLPICDSKGVKKNTSSISIHPKPKPILDMIAVAKKFHPFLIKNLDNGFSVYREADVTEVAELRGMPDLIVPSEKNSDKTTYLKCYHSRELGKYSELAGCGVILAVTDDLYVHYGDDGSVLSRLRGTNAKVSQLIKGFVVNSAQIDPK